MLLQLGVNMEDDEDEDEDDPLDSVNCLFLPFLFPLELGLNVGELSLLFCPPAPPPPPLLLRLFLVLTIMII